jgi:cytosine/adenosine deaminase-related metal-dependent hydrolase
VSIVHRAQWVLPIAAPPIRNGWVEVADGRIVAVGTAEERAANGQALDASGEPRAANRDTVAILPGLVNVHTHLELSWMAGRVPPSDSMGAWIRELMALRRSEVPGADEQRRAAGRALASARATGTVAIGDIGNSFVAIDVLADAGMPSVMFHELIGFRLGHEDARVRADDGVKAVMGAVRIPVKAGLSPHAPYSVSPDLFRAVSDAAAAHGLPSSLHLGESPEEIEFLMTGRGGIADTLKHLGAWNDAWTIPGQDPVEYLDSLGVLRSGLLTVHCTQLTPSALKRLAGRGCVLVSCPRSNRWVGAGKPPLDSFYESGAAVAFGTDSLASVADLNMFAELAAARAVSAVPAAKLLESATRLGAEALGFGTDLGTIEAGKRADLLAVRIPADIVDVEEYLVSGVDTDDIRWLPQ